MARNRSRTRVSRETNRRTWVWVRHSASSSIPTTQGVFANLFSEFESTYGAQLLGTTVMRIRGEVASNEDITIAARVWSEPLGGVAGMTAADDGPGAVPWQDWMWYEPLLMGLEASRILKVDVRSARKIEELQQGLLLAITNTGAGTADVKWDLSIGVKLP